MPATTLLYVPSEKQRSKDDGTLLAACADGAGSAPRSGEGARLEDETSASIAERTPVTLTLKGGADIATHLAEDAA